MRILFVTNGYPTDKHPEYCIFNKEQIDSLQRSGIHTERVFINAREHGRGEYLRSIRQIREKARNADLIHCFHGLSWLLTLLSNGRKKPLVVSFLNALENEYREFPPWLSGLFVRLTRVCLRPGDGVIFKDRLPGWTHDSPLVRNIPNGVNLEQFYPIPREQAIKHLQLDPAKRYILFVSSKDKFRKQKRYDIFNSIIQRLQNHPDYADIEPLYLVNESRERVPLYFNAASLHLLTSDFEGSPNSVKESLACNTPVVATDVGNVGFMLAGLSSCKVVTPRDEQALTEAIKANLDQNSTEYLPDQLKKKQLDMQSAAHNIKRLYNDVLDTAVTGTRPSPTKGQKPEK